MSELLELPVNWNGKELKFPMEMIRWGYTHRFKISIDNNEYLFEPDEEGHYRAIFESQLSGAGHDMELLRTVGETLRELMG